MEMRARTHLATLSILLLLPWLLALECSSQVAPKTAPANSTSEPIAERLQAIAASGTLADLRWPDFTDYRQSTQKLYTATNYAAVWVRDGQASPQALAVIAEFASSQKRGLMPEDYDASRWPQRLSALKVSSGTPDTRARFDVALTVCAMRYISDLHSGRVNPEHSEFSITIDQQKYDLPEFLTRKVLAGSNVSEIFNAVEPQYTGYKRTEAALQTYLALASQDHGAPLPSIKENLESGDAYPGIEQLTQHLRLLGDLPHSAVMNTKAGVYDGQLVEAVKHFQSRHGLQADGILGQETLRHLSIPLSDRVLQLEDALERWRWLQAGYQHLPVVVNIPEYILRTFVSDHRIAMRMNVVVGKELDQTPVFAKDMKYIVFRPYWNVPQDITSAEIVPALRKNKRYLASQNFEVTDQNGRVVIRGAVSASTLAQLLSGKLLVRQRPGPENSLGLVKFIFPNDQNVYLHSTPAQQLFSEVHRNFSHGCIRVEKPVELAAWLLQDQPKWTQQAINAAMNSGPDNQQVNLTSPVPVVIVYLTAIVEENGEVYFFDDVYGHDRSMNAALAKGQPYR
jgi:murein L,D-transpeptidase YcbB/YkuD